ncbi:MAG: aldehyde dehydrogenase family protein [Propioniciclava sp.]|uniref:aldehyde dehydrogenase family protein n=1 Tax=Propioniciclava sp. TaxID=2038686 RepID=UPI0039E34A79
MTTAVGSVVSGKEFVVTNPATGEEIGRLRQHTIEDTEHLLANARDGVRVMRGLSKFQRAAILDATAALLRERTAEVAELIVREAGKTIRQARKEVARAANTMMLSAEAARHGGGEVVPFDAFDGGQDRQGWFTREPLGIILAITPYNDALNLVAHKLGPAIAGGNAVILRPSQRTPFVARLLVDLMRESGLPAEAVTVVHGRREVLQAFIRARDIRMISFTGGFRTAEAIAAAAGLKRLSMELGGNAPVLVFEDADLDRAVEACVSGAFWAAGQNCIGAQRLLIQRTIYQAFRARFIERTRQLVTGDPLDEATDVGPMISPDAARAAMDSVRSAVAAGSTLLCGGTADQAFLSPTVLENVPLDHSLCTDEVFAPVVLLAPFDTYEQAIDLANRPDYALHAGVFTSNLATALNASRDLEVGGVMINDSSDFRIDAMPFGGAKYGSMGREGVRFAYEEMTQPKVVCLRT